MATRLVAEAPCRLRHFPLPSTLHILPCTILGKNTYKGRHGGSVKLIFTKHVDLISVLQSNHKPIGLWWDSSNEKSSIREVKMSFTDSPWWP